LRGTIDQLLDGQHTGRWDWQTLRKTEKTHMGTLVEINLHRVFDFADGDVMDYRIAETEVDCKFSQMLGGWEFPVESVGHICLLVWANDDDERWEAGLIRVNADLLGAPNRDLKRKLPRASEASVLWLYDRPQLPPNLLLRLTDEQRQRIFEARTPAGRPSGQARINELFRCIQKTIIPRTVILTVGIQDDPMKRARDARLPKHLGREGFLVLGHQGAHPAVARSLGVPVPRKGEFISVRVVKAEPGSTGPKAEINGTEWREANDNDPVVPAPPL
jgi:Restriction endonuclease NaeI